MLDAPNAIRIKTLHAANPSYDPGYAGDLWRLYAGGKALDEARADFIRQRRAEPQETYLERVARAFFCGYLGEIVDSFVANLFLGEPSFAIAGQETLPDYYQAFARDCTGNGTDLNAFHRARWSRALVQGCAWTWVELPEIAAETREALGDDPTLQQLEDAGSRDAYLIPVSYHELRDWKNDSHGRLEWATVHQVRMQRTGPFSDERTQTHRWTILGREGFAVYTFDEEYELGHVDADGRTLWKPKGGAEAFLTKEANLQAEGRHPFGAVPLVGLSLPPALVVGQKIAGIQRGIIELDNAITWQQLMSLFAMPVVKSGKEFGQMMGEGYFIQLEPEDSFDWSEPGGSAIQTSMDRREQLKEEMFRVAHQMAQAVKSSAQTAGRSGEAKRRDQTPTEIVLWHLASLARDYEQEILRMVGKSRQGPDVQYEWEINGFDEFDVDDLSDLLDDYLKADAAHVPSETLRKSRQRALADKLAPNADPEERRKIHAEIEAADPEDAPTDDNEPEPAPPGAPSPRRPAPDQ